MSTWNTVGDSYKYSGTWWISKSYRNWCEPERAVWFQQLKMNSLQIMNILKNDPFTKTVFTDVLPSDRLPREIRNGLRRYILNTDSSDMPGSHWVAMYLTEDGKGEFGIRMVRLLDFTIRTLLNFWTNIAVHLHGTEEFFKPLHQTCVDNIHYSLLYIDVDVFQCQPLQICLRIAKNGMMSLCAIL
jgi:hypothetical protein